VIDEDTGQPLAHRSSHEGGRDHGVDAAREGTKHSPLADSLSYPLYALLDEGAGSPFPLATTYLIEEIADYLPSIRGVNYFGVELQTIETPTMVPHGRKGGVFGIGQGHKTRGEFLDPIAMTHPDYLREREFKEERRGRIFDLEFHRAVLSPFRRGYPSSQPLG
jgi:hypothetical protein